MLFESLLVVEVFAADESLLTVGALEDSTSVVFDSDEPSSNSLSSWSVLSSYLLWLFSICRLRLKALGKPLQQNSQ